MGSLRNVTARCVKMCSAVPDWYCVSTGDVQCEGHTDAARGLQVRKSQCTCMWHMYCPSVYRFAVCGTRTVLVCIALQYVEHVLS